MIIAGATVTHLYNHHHHHHHLRTTHSLQLLMLLFLLLSFPLLSFILFFFFNAVSGKEKKESQIIHRWYNFHFSSLRTEARLFLPAHSHPTPDGKRKLEEAPAAALLARTHLTARRLRRPTLEG